MYSRANQIIRVAICPLLCSFLLLACAGKDSAPETATDTPAAGEIMVNEILHDTLSPVQMQKIQRIHKVFAEVEPVSFEETVNDFKRDQYPDREIEIWLAMADAYEQFVSKRPGLDLTHKQEAYKLILVRSMESEEASRQKAGALLTEAEITELLGYYKMEAKPLLFIKDEEGHDHSYGK